MAASSTRTSTSEAVSRFDLPGLNLPLNWEPYEPHEPHELHEPNMRSGNPNSSYAPVQKRGKKLFRTALNESDIFDGYTAFAPL
jgi:hypothetical protein